jgi:hypothetical protein
MAFDGSRAEVTAGGRGWLGLWPKKRVCPISSRNTAKIAEQYEKLAAQIEAGRASR